MPHFVYILECADSTYYCGYTVDLERRLSQHSSAAGSKYTRGRLPVRLVYYEECASRGAGLRREYQLKQLSRAEKSQLIANFNNRT